MIASKFFGTTQDLKHVQLYTLTNGPYSIGILDYGGTIVSIKVPDKEGKTVDVSLGYTTVAEYEKSGGYLGALIGRIGNRIAKGEFVLNGKKYKLNCNDGKNHLHGGKLGFDKKIWSAYVDGEKLNLMYISPDKEENYPGKLTVKVVYTLSKDGELGIEYTATTDADTIVNLTNHAYFNLNGEADGSIADNVLKIKADKINRMDAESITTGESIDVLGTPFDFNKAKPIGADIDADNEQIKFGQGFDHNFVLTKPDNELSKVAECYSEKTGIKMTVLTTQPGVQFYSGNMLEGQKGKSGTVYARRAGFCLETQQAPNSVNQPKLGSFFLKKGDIYQTKTTYKFGLKDAPKKQR